MATHHKTDPQLEEAARSGFNGDAYDPQRHGMRTSDKHAAFIVGKRLKFMACKDVFGVRKSRGDRVHANGFVWQVTFSKRGDTATIVD
jgi:hypothetical protein